MHLFAELKQKRTESISVVASSATIAASEKACNPASPRRLDTRACTFLPRVRVLRASCKSSLRRSLFAENFEFVIAE
eukprot:5239166-Pleurochrysis_carterae.AAC.1